MSFKYLYYAKFQEFEDITFSMVKIGVSGKGKQNANQRIKQLNPTTKLFSTIIPDRVWNIEGTDAYYIEQIVHDGLKEYGLEGEWFNDEGGECLNKLQQILEFINTTFSGISIIETDILQFQRKTNEQENDKKIEKNNKTQVGYELHGRALIGVFDAIKKLLGFQTHHDQWGRGFALYPADYSLNKCANQTTHLYLMKTYLSLNVNSSKRPTIKDFKQQNMHFEKESNDFCNKIQQLFNLYFNDKDIRIIYDQTNEISLRIYNDLINLQTNAEKLQQLLLFARADLND